MWAVVDTSILVRAVLRPRGSVGDVLQALRDELFTCVYTRELLEELVDVLGRPRIRLKYSISSLDVAALLALIMDLGHAVEPIRRIKICRDPKDDKVLEAAVAGSVDAIVTGDEDLLVLDPFEGINIMGAAQFLRAISARGVRS